MSTYTVTRHYKRAFRWVVIRPQARHLAKRSNHRCNRRRVREDLRHGRDLRDPILLCARDLT